MYTPNTKEQFRSQRNLRKQIPAQNPIETENDTINFLKMIHALHSSVNPYLVFDIYMNVNANVNI